ncbi:unnamed protein product [Prunus armeniaca]|uniref:Uncharacterized protein n=1 Tax=Prunus armeniaca TaxID=36596 RepID=A0A6J5XY13_PRUAR|nr:hypothetical protein GBA52_024166 [Prunus armeniaca]CAB4286763.1 unnamed protein product [Prunus armeniaca]CAB4317133.1 unnamed protein product [Prunus armeniaca]
MARFGTSSARLLMVMVAALLYVTKTMAQNTATPPTPLPVTGAGFASPVSVALICSSMLVSLTAAFAFC